MDPNPGWAPSACSACCQRRSNHEPLPLATSSLPLPSAHSLPPSAPSRAIMPFRTPPARTALIRDLPPVVIPSLKSTIGQDHLSFQSLSLARVDLPGNTPRLHHCINRVRHSGDWSSTPANDYPSSTNVGTLQQRGDNRHGSTLHCHCNSHSHGSIDCHGSTARHASRITDQQSGTHQHAPHVNRQHSGGS